MPRTCGAAPSTRDCPAPTSAPPVLRGAARAGLAAVCLRRSAPPGGVCAHTITYVRLSHRNTRGSSQRSMCLPRSSTAWNVELIRTAPARPGAGHATRLSFVPSVLNFACSRRLANAGAGAREPTPAARLLTVGGSQRVGGRSRRRGGISGMATHCRCSPRSCCGTSLRTRPSGQAPRQQRERRRPAAAARSAAGVAPAMHAAAAHVQRRELQLCTQSRRVRARAHGACVPSCGEASRRGAARSCTVPPRSGRRRKTRSATLLFGAIASRLLPLTTARCA